MKCWLYDMLIEGRDEKWVNFFEQHKAKIRFIFRNCEITFVIPGVLVKNDQRMTRRIVNT
jgi:hypothetical protein